MSHYPIRDNDAVDHRHPVDHIEPIENERSEQADALMTVLFWLLKSSEPTHIGARVMVLAVALGSDQTTWAEIGRRCDITREGIRLMAKELERDFGLRSNNARRDGTRQACKRARERVVQRGTNR